MTELIIQAFGYLATLLLALSLLVTNDIKFRWLNALGCVAFIVYGVLLQAYPIILTNTLLLVINVYYLVRIYQRVEAFELIRVKTDNPLVQKFLHHHQADIEKYFPGFQASATTDLLGMMVLRDMNMANLFLAHVSPEGVAHVQLNYTIPRYRDFKIGKFIFDREKLALRESGINEVFYNKVHNKSHEEFLLVSGFTKRKDGSFAKPIL